MSIFGHHLLSRLHHGRQPRTEGAWRGQEGQLTLSLSGAVSSPRISRAALGLQSHNYRSALGSNALRDADKEASFCVSP